MTSRILVGISGWRYEGWRGVFYPARLPQNQELHYASRALPTIEINGSFYSLQKPEYYRRWADDVPEDFVFSVKGPRYITHILRLEEPKTALANFFASGVLMLGQKLGPFLWQLPPSFQYDRSLLRNFLSLLPRDLVQARELASQHSEKVLGRAAFDGQGNAPLRHALEIRHPSFGEPGFIELLREHGVALVLAGTAGKWPYYEDVTADFMYLRLHGAERMYAGSYGDAALLRWAERIQCWQHGAEPHDAVRISAAPAPQQSARDVYCYFDNDVKARAPFDAARLLAHLGLPHAAQAEFNPPDPEEPRIRPPRVTTRRRTAPPP